MVALHCDPSISGAALKLDEKKSLGQYRTKIVRETRRRFFLQMKQKTQPILDVLARLFVKYDGKSASGLRAKPSGGLCAVLP